MRIEKAFKNIVFSAIYQVVSIACGLIVPRLILQTFGSTYNGVINSASQFLDMISILTLGITGATKVAFYKTLGNGDELGTSRIYKATKVYMSKVALGVIAYAVLLCVVYPLISHNDLSKLQTAAIIVIVSIGTFAQYFFGITSEALLQSDQSNFIIHSLNIIKLLVNLVVTIVLIKLGRSIFEVKLGSSIIYFITPLVMNLYVKKKYHIDNKCEPDNSAIKERGAAAFHSIANIIHDRVDLVLLTLFADAKIISVYTVYYLVVGKIKQVMQIFTSGVEAAFGNMWARGEMESLKRNFRAYEYVMFTFAAIVFSCVGLLILPFIKRYTSGVTDVEYIRPLLAILITVAESFHCIRQPYLMLVQAAGFYRETKNGAMAEALLNLAVSLVLINLIGIEGVILGTLAANLFRTCQYAAFVSKHILERSIKEIVLRFIWLVLTGAVIIFVSLFAEDRIAFSEGWMGWIAEGFVVFGIAAAITAVSSLLFYGNDVKYLISVVKRMLRRRSRRSQ